MPTDPLGHSARVVDYRSPDDSPDVCPVCGARITKGTARGSVHVGPADLEWARKYGITTEGPVTTFWTTWYCSLDPEHEWGPILLA